MIKKLTMATLALALTTATASAGLFDLELIGLLVMGSILGFGIYWVFTNITFKQVPEKYTYEGDKVIDHTDKLKGETK